MIDRALAAVARRGRWALVAGLVVGIASPALARAMEPAVAPLVAILLFLAVLRVGPSGLVGGLGGLPAALGLALALQLALPLAVAGALWAAGVLWHPVAAGLVMTLAAPPITGAPHMTAMVGRDPAPALRMLVVGTALLPLTAPPVLAALPALSGGEGPAAAALRLGAVVGLAVAAGLGLRAAMPPGDEGLLRARVDGLAALGLGAVVVGLMAGVAPALAEPARLAAAMGAAFAACLALQVPLARRGRAALAVGAGNRNAALMLGALSPEAAAEVTLFVGCYQIPMYLTPMILPRLLRSDRSRSRSAAR